MVIKSPSPGWRLLAGVGGSNRARLALTYVLVLVENLADLLYPFTIGLAIDGLLAGKPERMVPLIALWLAHLVVGLGRHLYDTRVFTAIYAEMATDVVRGLRSGEASDNIIVGRISLSRELTDFLQHEIPAVAQVLVKSIGAVVMLFAYDATVGAMAVAALVPMLAASGWFTRRAGRLNAGLNDRYENEVRIVARSPLAAVRRHFLRLRWWQVRISDSEATAWGIIELAAIGLTVAVLLRLTAMPGVTAGTIYAVLAYVFSFYEAASELPERLQNAVRVGDIGDRLAGPSARAS